MVLYIVSDNNRVGACDLLNSRTLASHHINIFSYFKVQFKKPNSPSKILFPASEAKELVEAVVAAFFPDGRMYRTSSEDINWTYFR